MSIAIEERLRAQQVSRDRCRFIWLNLRDGGVGDGSARVSLQLYYLLDSLNQQQHYPKQAEAIRKG
jgi:hypothetical protein